MSNLSFTKFQATGDDFVLIDDRDEKFPGSNSSLIKKICHRQLGIGADGVILLSKHTAVDFRMRIFNSDGLEAESCGNGLRCLVLFLKELGLFQKRYRIRTNERIVSAYLKEGQPVIEMGSPKDIRLSLATEAGSLHFIDTGV